jgi:hypothetical protein
MRDRSEAAKKAWKTIRNKQAWIDAHAAEAASKAAFEAHFKENGWRVAFFEGATGSPRTGIVDAIAFRIDHHNADLLDFRLVQLKGGKAGVSAKEIGRLKDAAAKATVSWLIVEYDSESKTLHVLPNEPDV